MSRLFRTGDLHIEFEHSLTKHTDKYTFFTILIKKRLAYNLKKTTTKQNATAKQTLQRKKKLQQNKNLTVTPLRQLIVSDVFITKSYQITNVC